MKKSASFPMAFRFKISTNRIQPMYAGISTFPLTAPLIVGVGRMSPEKGFDILVLAFGDIFSVLPDAHLLIAGEGRKQHRFAPLPQTLAAHVTFPAEWTILCPS